MKLQVFMREDPEGESWRPVSPPFESAADDVIESAIAVAMAAHAPADMAPDEARALFQVQRSAEP